MPFVKANDINLYYEEKGEGPALLLIPGFSQHSGMWKPYLQKMSKHFRVIALDNRGSGQSEAPEEGYSIEMLANDAAALLDALHIDSAYLIGSSMGSAICLQMCLTHPDKVKRAVLCSAFPTLPPLTRFELQTLIAMTEEGMDRKWIIRVQIPWLYSAQFLSDPDRMKKRLEEFSKDPYPQTETGLLGQTDALMQFDISAQAKNIPHPCLFISGENDILTPLAGVEFLSDRMLQAESVVLKDQAHMLHEESAKEVMTISEKFLSQELK